MTLKESMIDLAAAYEEIKKEALIAVNSVKSKTKDLTDIQRIQYLLEKRDFSLKGNLLAVFDLAERHNINVSKLNQLQKKYTEAEKAVLGEKAKLEDLGLQNISIGPRAMGALCNNGTVFLYINSLKKTVDVKVYPSDEDEWTGDFEKSAFQLKKNIEKVLNGIEDSN